MQWFTDTVGAGKHSSCFPENFFLLPSEDFCREYGRYLNVNNIDDQQWLRSAINKLKETTGNVEVIILDNLSSLKSNPAASSANSNDEDPSISLSANYAMKDSPVIARHAGMNQDQRGRSKQEDYLDLSNGLDSGNRIVTS